MAWTHCAMKWSATSSSWRISSHSVSHPSQVTDHKVWGSWKKNQTYLSISPLPSTYPSGCGYGGKGSVAKMQSILFILPFYGVMCLRHQPCSFYIQIWNPDCYMCAFFMLNEHKLLQSSDGFCDKLSVWWKGNQVCGDFETCFCRQTLQLIHKYLLYIITKAICL